MEPTRSPLIHELPEDERPREKLAARGAGALTDAELIAILLRVGVQGCSAIDVGRGLLKKFGSLNELARVPIGQLKLERGLGLAKAVQLAAAFGLAARLARQGIMRQPMDTSAQVNQLLGAELRAEPNEVVRVLVLDTKLCLVHEEEISRGTLNAATAHPRDILRPVFLHNGYGFILVHNHPSGDPSPSQADRTLTRSLRDAASLMQLAFLDHVIIGAGATPYFSFRDYGILSS